MRVRKLSELSEFREALRGWLGLSPLYDDGTTGNGHTHRTTPIQSVMDPWVAGHDGDGGRRVRPGGAGPDE